MTPSTRDPLLDHIVVLVPHAVLVKPPSWLDAALTLFPGGRHADNLTENKLVLFPDGSYLELIAFLPGVDRSSHRWGACKEGSIIDWALTLAPTDENTRPEDAFPPVRERVAAAGTGLEYGPSVAGGRLRPDGQRVEWAVAVPHGTRDAKVTGKLPFWCFDRTERQLRVPHDRQEFVSHPCGAVGVASVEVLASSDTAIDDLTRVYDAVLGQRTGGKAYEWHLDVPEQYDGKHSSKASLRRSEDNNIVISLYTRLTRRQLEGDIGNNQTLLIDLIPVD
jgi:hypothetical protein